MAFFAFLRANFRWLLAGFLLTAFSGFGQTFFIGLSAGSVRSEFGLSHGEFGTLYMAATLASAMSLPWVGRSLDRYPIPRVAAAVMVLLAVFCIAMAGVSSVAMLFFVIFGLRLFGQGMMSNTSMTAVGRWFDAQRGRAVSIAGLGFPVAEATLPISFVALSSAFGWRVTWLMAAAALIAFALPVILALLRRERTPQNMADGQRPGQVRHWTRSEVLRDPAFWVMAAGVLAPPFIATAVLFHQVYLVDLRGWTLELFASAFAVMSVTAVISSLILGALIDRYSARALLPFMLLPLSAACLVLGLIHQTWAAFLFMALMGVSNGFMATLIGALWPEVYGTRYLGAVRSVVFALMVLSSAIGPGLVGWLIDLEVSFDRQMMGMAAYCIAMTGSLTLVARHVHRRMERHSAG